MNIYDILRLQEVKRYPICHTNRDQSVAEHSYNVAMIAMELAEDWADPAMKLDIITYALSHDLEEVYTGDIPSSFKRRLRIECPAVIKLLDGDKEISPDVRAIVKLADCLEAIYYVRQFGGSRLAEIILPDMVMNFKSAANTENVHDAIRLKALAMEKSL
jgi:Predicted hydrolases of HD superfamily